MAKRKSKQPNTTTGTVGSFVTIGIDGDHPIEITPEQMKVLRRMAEKAIEDRKAGRTIKFP